jgi:glycosyltransferase involved in cell wall biosynthesis
MRVAWVNPCFLHYRVPVYAALDRLLRERGGGLHVIFSASRTPPAVRERLAEHLGERAVALDGETRLRLGGVSEENFANVGINIPYQSGLARAIEQSGADVIVSEGFFQWTPASLWVKRRKRLPMVITYEKTPHTERHAPRLRTLYRRWVCGQTDAICCNGRLSREYCTSVLGMPAERIVTGAMAADTEALAKRCATLGASEIEAARLRLNVTQRPVFLYVGRLIRLKGLHELLAGWERYTAGGGQGSLVLVGEGPERLALEAVVSDKKLPRVVFAGKAQYDEIALYYALADVLVMPTLEDNWSLVVPEAMACGRPVLCSTYNGCWPELVHDDVNGWVFDPNNATEIAGLMARCAAATPARLEQMGNESRRIIADFTPARAAEAVLAACELAESNTRRRAAS